MDRISNLPDELLVRILSFIPTTKVAVSTSILSKRWEYLWMWLPKLDYGRKDCPVSECESLRCFLDRKLPLHRSPIIESFRLELCNSVFKPENINTWVETALSRCLRDLDISLHDDTDPPKFPNILPSDVFTCKSLVILKLVGEILLDVPGLVSLPSLKTLKLQRLRYFNEETLQRLLSNCPILEDLVVDLRDYDYESAGKLTVAVPSLQSLSIYIPYYQVLDGIVIETPNLKYFKLMDHSINDHYVFIEKMSDLIEAYLDVTFTDLKSIFGSITPVKRLSICSEAIKPDEDFVFDQLEHLEVCICTLFASADQLIELLKASSKLKSLGISFFDQHTPSGMVFWNQPTTVPECILSSLQSFSWSKYTGEPEERDVVVYFLKHARQLETATIKSSEPSGVPKSEMLNELELSPRASATCQLMFD
ncbi:FBD-associated F-box protein [Raphanus sativus]|uniref:FBD-associated F-box protein At4g10400-like n=1 Tax=Raphanus sativus TaxID=3726 RepID=A0A9W3C8Q3_RAPSA|nr:FBD-associated F-box protein At4g10400-like [Raphanus sativus]KAJ4881720.1 FBD-associated F-box protein [Raphanus sativus]